VPAKTGDFFAKPTATSLAVALKKFKPSQYDNRAIAAYARQFSAENFRMRLTAFLKTIH